MVRATFTFTLALTAIVSLLLAVDSANAALNGASTFRDGDTLFAPTRNGEIVARPIVNMTTEIKVPGEADKINVPGTIEQVVAFLDATYPGYEWPPDEDYSATSSQFSPEDNTIYCNIGKQGSYFTAAMTQNFLRHFGYHKLSVGAGPGNCYRATCRTELGSVPVAFYLCNDDTQQVNLHYNDVADLAQMVMDKCVEFGAPLSWVRGQAFHASLPWNVIVTAEDRSYLKIDVGPNPPFALGPFPGKGWGAFATRPLAPGDIVFIERPIVVIQGTAEEISQADIFNSMQHLTKSERQQVTCLNRDRDTVSLEKLFRESEFRVSMNPPAHGMFLVLSRFNHSCIPNCRIPTLGGELDQLTIQASKAIAPGQELTFCYDPVCQLLTAEQRVSLFDFTRECRACRPGTSFHQASNMRRTLLRGLYYLVHGKDSQTGMPMPARPFSTEPELMKKAEELAIPLSTRLIAVILMAFPFEEEGLMDLALEASMLPNMNRFAVAFRSSQTVQISSRVMRHTNFMGKFCAALKLYEKRDLADREVAEALQQARGDDQL